MKAGESSTMRELSRKGFINKENQRKKQGGVGK
jgi:hypothetical protein